MGERSLRRWSRLSATLICLCIPVAAIAFLLWITRPAVQPVLYVKHCDQFLPLDAWHLQFLRYCAVGSIGFLLFVQSAFALALFRERRTYYTMIRRLDADGDRS
jgi:hypothetical protein